MGTDTQKGGWRAVDGSQKGEPQRERPQYAAIKVADHIYAVSYLAPSGYTLTVVLNFREHETVRRRDFTGEPWLHPALLPFEHTDTDPDPCQHEVCVGKRPPSLNP